MSRKASSAQSRLGDVPLFWKVYGLIVGLLLFVVGLAEFILEPLAQRMLAGLYGGFQPWHEAAVWTVSILVPSLASGYVLSTILSVKLGNMAKAAKALARGNLEIRLPATGNEADAFDVLAHSFNEMALAIKTQRQYGRRLLADISHELRSPLTRMSVATGLLARRHGAEEREALMRRLEKELERMNELVSMLLLQGSDKGKAAAMEPVGISAVLLELTDDFAFQGKAQQKSVLLEASGDPVVYGNTALLQRMFGNLLANAVFYTPENSAVDIRARTDGDNLVVTIRDYGPGVPEDQLEEIFRAFYRVDTSRARTSGGVGLGLALARETAIHHGGNIVARNAGTGLLVTVTLPLHANGAGERPACVL